jgi:hypothetical protein
MAQGGVYKAFRTPVRQQEQPGSVKKTSTLQRLRIAVYLCQNVFPLHSATQILRRTFKSRGHIDDTDGDSMKGCWRSEGSYARQAAAVGTGADMLAYVLSGGTGACSIWDQWIMMDARQKPNACRPLREDVWGVVPSLRRFTRLGKSRGGALLKTTLIMTLTLTNIEHPRVPRV